MSLDFLQAQTGRRMLMFHGIDWHTDSEDRRRLITYMEAHRVAGVIFSNGIGSWMENTPILDLPGIPRVVIGSGQQFAHIPVVKFDDAMWIDKALDHLAARVVGRGGQWSVGSLLRQGYGGHGWQWAERDGGVPSPEENGDARRPWSRDAPVPEVGRQKTEDGTGGFLNGGPAASQAGASILEFRTA